MKNEKEEHEKIDEKVKKDDSVLAWKISAIGAFVLLAIVVFYSPEFRLKWGLSTVGNDAKIAEKIAINSGDLSSLVLPSEGVVLPINWDNLGKKMIDAGVIDAAKFESIYARRGGLSNEDKKLLYGSNNGNITINQQNSGVVLNLLWAFGLANKNPVLEEGPMVDKKYGGAGRFASTGGWTIAKGSAMDYYSKLNLVTLTDKQQDLVERVSKNIYRPCCGNSTYFPDCNHGMAMLGLLELLAAEGVGESDMYKIALKVNSYWFPDTYLTIAKYFNNTGVSWNDVDAKEVLGSAYSSAAGFRSVLTKVQPTQNGGGGGCGV